MSAWQMAARYLPCALFTKGSWMNTDNNNER